MGHRYRGLVLFLLLIQVAASTTAGHEGPAEAPAGRAAAEGIPPALENAFRPTAKNPGCRLHDAKSVPADEPILDPDGFVVGGKGHVLDWNEPLRALMTLAHKHGERKDAPDLAKLLRDPGTLRRWLDDAFLEARRQEAATLAPVIGKRAQVKKDIDGIERRLAAGGFPTSRFLFIESGVKAVPSLRKRDTELRKEQSEINAQVQTELNSPKPDDMKLGALLKKAGEIELEIRKMEDSVRSAFEQPETPSPLFKDPAFVAWNRKHRPMLPDLEKKERLEEQRNELDERHVDVCDTAEGRLDRLLQNRALLLAFADGWPPVPQGASLRIALFRERETDGTFNGAQATLLALPAGSGAAKAERFLAVDGRTIPKKPGKALGLESEPDEYRWLRCGKPIFQGTADDRRDLVQRTLLPGCADRVYSL